MGEIWHAFKSSYRNEGLTGAKTPEGGKAYAFETGYDIGTEMRISGFEIGYVRRRSGLGNNQQVLAVLTNLKFQRYFIGNGSLALYNSYDTTNARSRLLGKRIEQWIEREGLTSHDIPARASYQAANPAAKDRNEVIKYGGTDVWINKEGGEAKDIPIPDIPLPDMPSLSLPSMSDMGGVKRSLQVSALIFIGVLLLIVYMLTGGGRKGVTVVT